MATPDGLKGSETNDLIILLKEDKTDVYPFALA